MIAARLRLLGRRFLISKILTLLFHLESLSALPVCQVLVNRHLCMKSYIVIYKEDLSENSARQNCITVRALAVLNIYHARS